MNLRNEFNRIGHLLQDGVGKTHKTASDWADLQAREASGMAQRMRRQVRDQVDTGSRSLISAEEALVRHVRQNPAMYLIGAALLIGALIAKLMMESSSSRDRRQVPLM